MSYSRTTWSNGATALSAENMNNIEDGINEALDGFNNVYSKSEVYNKTETYSKTEVNTAIENVVDTEIPKTVVITGSAENVATKTTSTVSINATALAGYGIDDLDEWEVIAFSQAYSSATTRYFYTSNIISVASTSGTAYSPVPDISANIGSTQSLALTVYNGTSTTKTINYRIVLMKVAENE